jgi:hypothetical protein
MNRKTLTALGLFVILGALAIFTLKQPEKGERTSDRVRPIAKLNPSEIEALEITKAGQTTVLKSEGGKYKVTAPLSATADEAAAKAAWEMLGRMDVSDLVTDQKAKQAEFEVEDKSGVRVVAKGAGGKVLADFLVGKSGSAGTAMVRLPGKDEIWQASGISRFTVDKTTTDWRDKTITTFTGTDAEQLEVATKDEGKVVLKKSGAKEGAEDKWEIVETTAPKLPKTEPLDQSVPSGIVGALSSWRANDFADGAKPGEVGLEPPASTVTVTLKGGKKVAVLLGNKKGEDEVYVKTPENPQVFVVKKFNLERVNKRPIDFRDKTLCNIPDSDVAEIAVSRGANSFTLVKSGPSNNDWKATKPPKLELDPAKVTPIASAFKEMKATGFADEAAAKTAGLAKPQATIAVKAKSKGTAACLIKVGDETKDKTNYNVLGGTKTDVMLMPKWSLDRVLVKVDDLKKK